MSIKRIFTIIKRNLGRYIFSDTFRARFYFAKYYGKLNVKENSIFFESYSGNNFSGNVYNIYKEIASDGRFENFKKYIGVQKKNCGTVKSFLKANGLTDFQIVKVNSLNYCKALITSKYLFNNSTLPTYYIKNSKQILLNTWHGTPLKTLGKKVIGGAQEIGNGQRNFIMSDYLAFPNEFTFQHLREDFMLDQFFHGKYLLDGYPRNHVFYEREKAVQLKNRLGLNGIEVICYMPTWRGYIDAKESQRQIIELQSYLRLIDASLNEKKLMYVNLHNFVKDQIDLSAFKYIKSFPKMIETYEFLAISDCLVTDYSSVFFDYANMKKKIVLFAYDKDEYLSTRGLYFPMEQLPFPIVTQPEDLIKELSDLSQFNQYDSFIEAFCKYDKNDSAKDIVNLVFFNQKNDSLNIIDGMTYANKKKNILIYAGSLAKNGLTSSLKGLINHIDLNKYNYTLLFYRSAVLKNKQEINEFPEKISFIPIQGARDITIKEAVAQFLYYHLNLDSRSIQKIFKDMFIRENKRIFPGLKFDYAIHFTGYERHMVHLINCMENTCKIIYVHSNMKKEMETRSNFHALSIFKAYREFDRIVGVREGIENELTELLPIDKRKISIINNVNNIEAIIEKSKLEIQFDMDTESTHTVEEIKDILFQTDCIKFINVARFSPEKGLLRLIKAFEIFQETEKKSYLIVIGGHGEEYEDILNYVMQRNLKNVIIIKSLSNPYNILNQCDYFILSSLYEGLPMSIMEALILNKPVICTEIEGPKVFLSKGYGYLVENSTEGLVKGMTDALNKRIHLKEFDAYAFNRQALESFYQLFEE